MENQKEGQEIDLLRILSVCVRQLKVWLACLCNFLVSSLRFAYKKRKYMVCTVICAAFFTAFWARPSHRSFQMESEIRIHVLDAFFFKDMVSDLNHMCLNNDRSSLARVLGVGEDVARKLNSANSFFIVDKLCDGTPDEVCFGEYVADTTKVIMKDRLLVQLVISDTSLVDSISNGIIRYFDSNPYVSQSNRERVYQIDDQIASIDNEVQMLDSLRKFEYFKKTTTEMKLTGPLIVSEKSKELYYNDILTLENSRNEKMFERAVSSKSVNFIRNFVLINVQNKYIPTFFISFFIFAGIALIIALLVDEKARIKSFLER